jgi:hypothetical protein
MAFGPANYSDHIAGGLVRELWPDEALIEEVILKDSLLGAISKDTNYEYAVKHFPLGWGGSQGIGRNAADAKRFKSNTKSQEFQVSTKEMYEFLSLEGKLLRAARAKGGGKGKALLVDPVTREGERALANMRLRFSKSLHGDGVGVLGRISGGSNVATATITLTDGNDLKNFPVDTPLMVESTGALGGTPLTGEGRVLRVGTYDSPTVTLTVDGTNTAVWSDVFPGIAAGDRLYLVGTYSDDFIYGLDAFNPAHTGTPGTFLTCNRDLNPTLFAGHVMDGSTLTCLQRVKRAARILYDYGEEPDIYIVSTRTFEKFEAEAESKMRLDKVPAASVGKYNFGVNYDAYVVQGPAGPIKIMTSVFMPDNVERCGKLSTLELGSIGNLVGWDVGNGPQNMRTEDATDSRELRAVSDPAFVNKHPGAWMRVATST